jgi:hypothetical protein
MGKIINFIRVGHDVGYIFLLKYILGFYKEDTEYFKIVEE